MVGTIQVKVRDALGSQACVSSVFPLITIALPRRPPFPRVGGNEMSLCVKAEDSFILEETVTSLQSLHPKQT